MVSFMSLRPSVDDCGQVIQVCIAEAKARGEKFGARDISTHMVEDIDEKSDGRASVRTEVDGAIPDKDGKLKIKKKTLEFYTRHGVAAAFSHDGS